MKLGKAFSDNLIIEQKQSKRFAKTDVPSWWLGAGRALLFATVFVVALFALVFRLFDLTVIRGHELRGLADGNRIRELIRHAPRGLLLDRTGKPLVENIADYRLVKPCEADKSGQECVVHVTASEKDQLTKKGLPSGTFLEVDYSRRYPLGDKLSHVVGFTGELNQKELSDDYFSLRNYRQGDRIGRSGAEKVYEEKLRGRDGRELVEINANGTTIRTLGRDNEIAGEDVTLSIDLDLAGVVADAFPPGAKGAVIVTKPATGEILAMYSAPSFDPNKFSQGLTASEYQNLMNNPDRPMFDRALGGVYPPGSTFKIVMALGGLEDGVFKKDTVVDDTGILTIGPFSFPNWYFAQYGKTEGLVNIVKAIARSNDIFFYKAGEWMGITKIAAWSQKVGIGKPLGIELPGEAGGLVPDPAWKKAHFTTPADVESRNNLWYLGDTYHVSIGQGYLLTSPLQVNTWTNIIASAGKLCRPTIEKVQSGFGSRSGQNCKDLGIKKETIKLITEGMRLACETGGTGWPLFDFKVQSDVIPSNEPGVSGVSSLNVAGITSDTSPGSSGASPSAVLRRVPVACKTGTAEFGDPNNRTHAWFTAFAPLPEDHLSDSFKGETLQGVDNNNVVSGDPEISVTVLVEEGGEGSSVAAPIAKKILEAWFKR